MTKKLDDWSWHCGGDFPSDLPPEAGATHIAMFFAWAITSGIGSEDHLIDTVELNCAVHDRKLMPTALFMRACDGKLLDDNFNEEGKAFAAAYYENANYYFVDYENALIKGHPTLYHVADSWATFDKLRAVLNIRFDEWKSGTLKLSPNP